MVCTDGKVVSFDAQLEPTKEITIDGLVGGASISFKNDGKVKCYFYKISSSHSIMVYRVADYVRHMIFNWSHSEVQVNQIQRVV